MSGSEITSRTSTFGHVCTPLEAIYVILNFTSSVLSSPGFSPHQDMYLGGSQSSPSNLELTIGKFTTIKRWF